MKSRLEITRRPEGGAVFAWAERIWEERKFLAKIAAAGLAASILVVLLLPAQYTARVVLLPSGKQDKLGVLSGLASSMGFDLSGTASGLESSSLLYPDILKSRIIGEAILIHTYRYTEGKKPTEKTLYAYLNAKDMERGLKKLAKRRGIEMDVKTGIITLEMTTGNRELSALAANQYTAELERYNRERRKTQAFNNQQNIERRLDSVKTELAASEEALEAFLEKNRDFALSDDPELNRRLTELKREVLIKSETYATLTQQHELAKIETEREIPIVQVLDVAVPPVKKSAPKRTVIVLVTTLFAVASGMLWIYLRHLLYSRYGLADLKQITEAWVRNRPVQNALPVEEPAR